jgi:putative ABC transport system permease protein
MVRGVVGVIAGSIIYRCIYAAALRFNVPADYMKLVSAIIVGAAIAAPAVRRWAAFQMQKRRAKAAAQGHYSELIKALHGYDYR